MQLHNHPHQNALMAGLMTLFITSSLSIIIYFLAIGFIQQPYHLPFRFQLFSLTGIISLIVTLGFYLYGKYVHYRVARQTPTLTSTENQVATLTVLIVDDNPANCLVIDNMMKSHQVNTLFAHNGIEAIERYQKHSPNLIFMDIELNGMSGIEALKTIRFQEKASYRVPIVAVSAHDEQDKRYQALLAGFNDYLTKPVQDKALFDALLRWRIVNPEKLTKKNTSIYTIHNAKPDEAPTPSIPTKPSSIKHIVSIEKSLAYSHHNKPLAKDMLALLIKMIKEEKQHFRTLYQQRDWPALTQLTHKLYGGSCYCGVPQLQEYCRTANNMLQQENYDHIDQTMKRLLSAMEDILIWSEEYDIEVIFE
ncbi:hypothetical protein AB835_08770 [Candidatus Endobugula sertula]|uniref:Response regulatory domain-containing protein n=1 Tax=Candidatus Endobugula sertula TaxID=62101 RepID=A0A1D2QPG5_9GAMM|nr:hypothetical protein AB835_08770 [Candidatus Endobugula sertula]